MSHQKRQKVYTGQISYILFQICGLWKPTECKSQWKQKLYLIYHVFTATVYCSYTFFIFLNVFQTHENAEAFTLNIFYLSTFVSVLVKGLVVVVKRKIFIKSNEMLLCELCSSRDAHETEILKKCSQIGRISTLLFLGVVHVTGLTILFSPMLTSENRTLPIPYWEPYSLESDTAFILLYLHQTIAIVMSIQTTVAMETLALAVMLQTCGQMQITMHRLSLIPESVESGNHKISNYQREAESTKDCIRHHLYTYSIGENINKQFGVVIFMQFFVSTLNICIIIYNVSKVSLRNSSSWIMLSSIGSYLFQIYIYCYYGDKMTETSSNIGSAVYTSSWYKLEARTQKDLVTLMIRTTRPVKLTAASVIIMSIETFMKIIKSAYSAYNLLKNS